VGRRAKGVLSGQEADRPQGLAVRVLDALRALERHDAAAAQWWRETMPHPVKPGQLFVFPGEACELVEEIEPPG
jgi:hypothetical protein